MEALVLGAGKIARGFIGQILDLSGYKINFVDANQDLVNQLKTENNYLVHVLGDPSKDSEIRNFNIYHTDELKEIHHAINRSNVIFVSVGGNGLKPVGNMIGTIFKKYGLPNKDISIITCENVNDAGTTLKKSIELTYPHPLPLGICESAVMRTATIPSLKLQEAEPLSVWVQDFWELPVDKEKYIGPPLNIKGLAFIDNFGSLLTQKMYTNNTSNAIIAYHGAFYGHKILSEAANSPEIAAILDVAYEEINDILITSLGVTDSSQKEFSKRARAKYTDPVIVDTIQRIAMDPIRKLGPTERLIGPAKLAIEHNIIPHVLIDTIVKAIKYIDPQDPQSVKLYQILLKHGHRYILENICELKQENPLYQLIDDRMKEEICIIGAGQTGRGFINRILNNNQKYVTFIDKDSDLVNDLKKNDYQIYFSQRDTISINNYNVYHTESDAAITAINNARYIFVSVGASNLDDIKKYLVKHKKTSHTTYIMTLENGVNVSEKLNDIPHTEVSEGIVFCTTLNQGLNIFSEDLDWIPYDKLGWSIDFNLKGFEAHDNLSTLMERKIYTYNCLSAVVAYLGYLYGYEIYGESANDTRVKKALLSIRKHIDEAISNKYQIPTDEQSTFSMNAIRKFQDKSILDTISRNTRDVKRKLSKNERIIAPLLLMNEPNDLLFVTAAAGYYGIKEESLTNDTFKELLVELSPEFQKIILNHLKTLMDS